MKFLLVLLVFSMLCLVQNFVFTRVSRSRQGADLWHHWRWSIASNGIWYVNQILIWGMIWSAATTGTWWQTAVAGLVYVVSTSLGSVWGMSQALKKETGKQKVGARADDQPKEHLWQICARQQRLIDAMREYRALHNAPLKVAKDAVEGWLLEQGIAYRDDLGWVVWKGPVR